MRVGTRGEGRNWLGFCKSNFFCMVGIELKGFEVVGI